MEIRAAWLDERFTLSGLQLLPQWFERRMLALPVVRSSFLYTNPSVMAARTSPMFSHTIALLTR